MNGRPPSALLLAPLGVLVGHEIAYSVLEAGSRSPAHGYLDGMREVLLATGLTATVIVGVAQISRHVPLTRISLGRLVAVQAGLLAIQELTERSGDAQAAFADPAVLVALALQLPVAWLLLRLAASSRLVERVVQSAGVSAEVVQRSDSAALVVVSTSTVPARHDHQPLPPSRGPPLVLV